MYFMQGENPPTHYISKKILWDTVVSLEKESHVFILDIISDCSWHKNIRGNILIVQHLNASLHVNQTYERLDILFYFTSTFSIGH